MTDIPRNIPKYLLLANVNQSAEAQIGWLSSTIQLDWTKCIYIYVIYYVV